MFGWLLRGDSRGTHRRESYNNAHNKRLICHDRIHKRHNSATQSIAVLPGDLAILSAMRSRAATRASRRTFHALHTTVPQTGSEFTCIVSVPELQVVGPKLLL